MNANHDYTGRSPGHHHDRRSASRRSLSISLALIMAYMVVEVIGGLVSGSLALLADAGHMLTDGAAIGLALLAIWVSGRPASIEQTFGFHRTEILAATKKHGKTCAMMVTSAAQAHQLRDDGVLIVNYSSDVNILIDGYKVALSELRE